MLRRAVLFVVKITFVFWLQGGNLLTFPEDMGDLHRRRGENWLAASLLLVLMHEPDWISQSKTGSRVWQ